MIASWANQISHLLCSHCCDRATTSTFDGDGGCGGRGGGGGGGGGGGACGGGGGGPVVVVAMVVVFLSVKVYGKQWQQ